jgi:hypothetical protein
MNNIFQKNSSHWAKYSDYEYRRGKNGNLYITPTPTAKPSVYDPLKNAEAMVVDAVNVGRLGMKKVGKKKMRDAVMGFVLEYGLLGFMTALPTTPDFLDYHAVYLPKNHFLKEETMPTNDYVALYFPFDKPDFYKDERTMQWNVQGGASIDTEILALAMTFSNDPVAMNMSLQRNYAERFDWLVDQFIDLAFSIVGCRLYYKDYDSIDERVRDIYSRGMSAFGAIAPTYHIRLYSDKPTIVWNFHSLLRGIQMMFSFALTDETNPLRLCENCSMAFFAKHLNEECCSPECEDQYNEYLKKHKKQQDSD